MRYPRGYRREAVDTGRETYTQQQFANEVDINTIVRRFGLTREMPSGRIGGVFGDFTGIFDYESAVAAVERAGAGFMALPPDIREKFGNDPGRLIEFVELASDEEVAGLTPPVAPVAPVEPAVVPA